MCLSVHPPHFVSEIRNDILHGFYCRFTFEIRSDISGDISNYIEVTFQIISKETFVMIFQTTFQVTFIVYDILIEMTGDILTENSRHS